MLNAERTTGSSSAMSRVGWAGRSGSAGGIEGFMPGMIV
jgi:hypothetical protein